MEKSETVITPKGYKIKVAAHMLNDLAKFGATKQKPAVKPAPKELIMNPVKKIEPIAKTVEPGENLPEMKTTDPIIEPEVKERKAPVRSKSKK